MNIYRISDSSSKLPLVCNEYRSHYYFYTKNTNSLSRGHQLSLMNLLKRIPATMSDHTTRRGKEGSKQLQIVQYWRWAYTLANHYQVLTDHHPQNTIKSHLEPFFSALRTKRKTLTLMNIIRVDYHLSLFDDRFITH